MKNKIQFQKGYSLIELMRDDGTEEQCRNTLFQLRWPQGYVCPQCGGKSHCTLKTRALYQCNHCHHQQSLIISQLPIANWYKMIGDAPLDRLPHNSHKLKLKGESMRKTLSEITDSDHSEC